MPEDEVSSCSSVLAATPRTRRSLGCVASRRNRTASGRMGEREMRSSITSRGSSCCWWLLSLALFWPKPGRRLGLEAAAAAAAAAAAGMSSHRRPSWLGLLRQSSLRVGGAGDVIRHDVMDPRPNTGEQSLDFFLAVPATSSPLNLGSRPELHAELMMLPLALAGSSDVACCHSWLVPGGSGCGSGWIPVSFYQVIGTRREKRSSEIISGCGGYHVPLPSVSPIMSPVAITTCRRHQWTNETSAGEKMIGRTTATCMRVPPL